MSATPQTVKPQPVQENFTPGETLFPTLAVERLIQEVRICPCCGEAMVLTPRIQCKHCNSALEIKCQVYKKHSFWYAECLTLNLLSRGEDELDAIRRLQVAMFSYIATVTSGEGATEGLIPRKAPASSWVRYYSHEVAARVMYLVGRRVPLLIRSVPIAESEELKIVHCS